MDTVSSSSEISVLFSTGNRFHSPYLTLIIAPCLRGRSHKEGGRVAFIAGKKLGNAVWRNSAKRRMRAICRSLDGPWNGYDVVFLAKKRILEGSYAEVVSSTRMVFGKAGIEIEACHED